MPFTLAVPQALYTRPETQLLYTTPTCRTSECRWEIFTSLAVCLDMKSNNQPPVRPNYELTPIDVTDQLDIHGDEVYTDISGPNGGSNITLPNGAMLHPTYGYRNSNISVATSGMPSLSLNETGNMIGTVPILGYTMIYYPPLRAYEMLLHFCVNTYNVSVTNNIATVTQVASYTNADYGEAFVARYNTTYNVTYLTTPDNPGFKYVAAGYGPSEIGSSLATSIGGAYSYLGGYNMSAGTAVFGTALERAEAGITSNDSQAVDDVRYAAIYNLSSNIAMGLTNA